MISHRIVIPPCNPFHCRGVGDLRVQNCYTHRSSTHRAAKLVTNSRKWRVPLLSNNMKVRLVRRKVPINCTVTYKEVLFEAKQ